MATMRRRTFNWKLPPEIEVRLGEGTFGRQRAISESGHLLVILHSPPAPGTIERESVVFLRKPDGALLCNGFEGGEHKLRKLLADYRAAWEECDKAYDTAETAEDLVRLLEKVAPLNRSSTNLIHGLENRSPIWFVAVLGLGLAIGFVVKRWVVRSIRRT